MTRAAHFLEVTTSAVGELEKFSKKAKGLVSVDTPAVKKVDTLLGRGLDVSAADKFRAVSDGVHVLAEAMDKMTPEKRQQLRDDLSKLAVAGKPFAEELRPLFEAVNSQPQTPGPANDTPAQAPDPEVH